MTSGRSGAPEPIDITAVRHSGEIVDALAARRHPPGIGDTFDDPAIRLLQALIADVDGLPAAAVEPQAPARRSCRARRPRRGARAFVALGVTAAMMAATGAAAATGVVPRVAEPAVGQAAEQGNHDPARESLDGTWQEQDRTRQESATPRVPRPAETRRGARTAAGTARTGDQPTGRSGQARRGRSGPTTGKPRQIWPGTTRRPTRAEIRKEVREMVRKHQSPNYRRHPSTWRRAPVLPTRYQR